MCARGGLAVVAVLRANKSHLGMIQKKFCHTQTKSKFNSIGIANFELRAKKSSSYWLKGRQLLFVPKRVIICIETLGLLARTAALKAEQPESLTGQNSKLSHQVPLALHQF